MHRSTCTKMHAIPVLNLIYMYLQVHVDLLLVHSVDNFQGTSIAWLEVLNSVAVLPKPVYISNILNTRAFPLDLNLAR